MYSKSEVRLLISTQKVIFMKIDNIIIRHVFQSGSKIIKVVQYVEILTFSIRTHFLINLLGKGRPSQAPHNKTTLNLLIKIFI